MRRFLMRLGVVAMLASLAPAFPASAQGTHAKNETLDLQVRLARVNASPGPIDGKIGKNMQFAISAFQRMRGLEETGRSDRQLAEALSDGDREPTLVDYVITRKDVAGPFLQRVPAKLEQMATLKHLGYTDR